jgi:urea transporter
MRWGRLLVECVLRGYGQLFLANRPASGACFALGLFLVSPSAGLLSLLGATTLTAMALIRSSSDTLLRSGLFGVNGVLVGFAWLLYPEVDPRIQICATVTVCVLLGLVLPPVAEALRDRSIPIFTLPYVLVMWATLIALVGVGRYDLRFSAGWSALATDPARAERLFAAADVGSERAKVYRQDGLGWAAYRQGDDGRARRHFAAAIERRADFADAHDGLGWCCLRRGELDAAESAFRAAVALDPWIGDAWDGLGWILLDRGDAGRARECFRRAIMATPLASDPYRVWSRSQPDAPDGLAARLARLSEAHIARRFQWTPTGQIACWILMAIGLLLHSRTSTVMAIAALAGCVATAHLWPGRAEAVCDPRLLYNLLPLVLALGGHYLTLGRVTVAWIAIASVGMIVVWPMLTEASELVGLPLLCLPFNLFFVGSLVAFRGLGLLGVANRLVPMELAVTSPEDVRLWQRRRAIAQACWRRIDALRPTPQNPVPRAAEP